VGTVVARVLLKERLQNFSQLKALSIVGSSMTLSPLCAPFLGALLTHFFGWRSIFTFLSLFSACLLIGTFFFMNASKPSLIQHSIHPKALLYSYIAALKNPSFLLPTLTISLACSGEFAFILNSSFFYQKTLLLNPYIYSALISVILCSFLIGSYILNKSTNYYGASIILKRTIQICCIASFFPLIGWLIGPKTCGILLALSTVITMTGVGVIVPLTQSIALNISQVSGAAIAGLFFFLELLCIFITGYFISMFSQTALAMLSGILLCWLTLALVEPHFGPIKTLHKKEAIN
jgi:predicted MFS family arabinose efflux permease